MPFTDIGRSRGFQFRPVSKVYFYVFVANFLILTLLGAKHVESPFIEFGQISALLYFSYFLVLVPFASFVENTLIILHIKSNDSSITETILSILMANIPVTIGGVAVSCFIPKSVNGLMYYSYYDTNGGHIITTVGKLITFDS